MAALFFLVFEHPTPSGLGGGNGWIAPPQPPKGEFGVLKTYQKMLQMKSVNQRPET